MPDQLGNDGIEMMRNAKQVHYGQDSGMAETIACPHCGNGVQYFPTNTYTRIVCEWCSKLLAVQPVFKAVKIEPEAQVEEQYGD